MQRRNKQQINPEKARSDRGFTVLAVALSLVALVALAGLAVDIGRMYIAKNEVQTFADSASLAATMELDGSWEGIARAESRAYSNPNRWNFNTSYFNTVQISYAKVKTGPWELNPLSPGQYKYARVTGEAEVSLTFLSVLIRNQSPAMMTAPLAMWMAAAPKVSVRGDSAAGQEPKYRWREGLFPFSPYALSTSGPYYGLVPGQLYTLRWPSNPKKNVNVCPGDNFDSVITLAEAGGGAERGYIESTSADIIRATIEQDYQSVERVVGEPVFMSGGAKESQRTALMNRINQDRDYTSSSYAQYVAENRGNGRRIVGAPINTGYPNYTIVQIGAFLLLPGNTYGSGGNQAWCAEYLGAWLQGSQHKAAGDPGAYVARIVK